MRQTPEEMARIQNIQRQPSCCVNAPPSIGPIAVAMLGLWSVYQLKERFGRVSTRDMSIASERELITREGVYQQTRHVRMAQQYRR